MATSNDRAVKMVGARRTLLVTPPEVGLAPAQIRRAARRCFGLPLFNSDAIALYAVALAVAMLMSRYTDSATLATLATAAAVAALIVLVPLARRTSARRTLARVDLTNAIHVDLPNLTITEAADQYRRWWTRRSPQHQDHLVHLWSLAQDASTDESGRRFRPDHGPCPGCGAGETTRCADWCDHLNRTDIR